MIGIFILYISTKYLGNSFDALRSYMCAIRPVINPTHPCGSRIEFAFTCAFHWVHRKLVVLWQKRSLSKTLEEFPGRTERPCILSASRHRWHQQKKRQKMRVRPLNRVTHRKHRNLHSPLLQTQ